MNTRQILIKGLELYRKLHLASRRWRGVSAEQEAARRVVSGQSWEEFCDTLKAAGAAVSAMGAPQDAQTQAEGYRYLTRLLRAGLEAFMEFNDPRAPTLRRMVHETVKMGSDNPDNHYLNATISGAYDYRLSGTRGTVHFLGFSTQKGGYGEGAGLPPTGFLDSRQLQLEPDGRFEVVVSCRPHSGNWLPMEPDTGLLIVRQTFGDATKELPAQLELERIDGDGMPSSDSVERIDQGLATASKLVAGASLLFARWAREFRGHANQLPQFDPERSTSAGGDPQIAYYHSYWELQPDQALVVRLSPPQCEHWNFQLNNHWMESLDYRHHRIHVNKFTAQSDADGRVTIVVAHRDPGHPNWLSTTGHLQGTMCLRWIHAETHPTPQTEVVKLTQIEGAAR